MKIGVLTSSRADYGIYLPLLNAIKKKSSIFLEIIAFGTHLSRFHGYTVDDIESDNYNVVHKISSLLTNDDEESIASSYGLTVLRFAEFWGKNNYDLVFCLGDRFEMNAAVQAGIPFQISFAHIHGGETTLGAIDNIYRHQISLASKYHFVATSIFKAKLKELLGNPRHIYNVGSLSLNDISSFIPIDKNHLLNHFNISVTKYILATFHPETVVLQQNKEYAQEMKNALDCVADIIPLVITMPNADTLGSVFRTKLELLKEEKPNQVFLVENFGKDNYFSAMYHSEFMIGNTSSGIIEAASFKKYVLNVGHRQKGRVQSDNVINVSFSASKIISRVNELLKKGPYEGNNEYYKENSVGKIMDVILNKIK